MMPSDTSATLARPAPLLDLFRPKPVGSWVALGTAILYISMCWIVFFAIVLPFFKGTGQVSIEADSTTYYVVAGIDVAAGSAFSTNNTLLTFAGNLLGPVLIAKLLRDPLFVAIFNCILLAIMVQMVALIPGTRRRYFLLLFCLNAQSVPAILTLNKEILASFGLVAFLAAVESKPRRYWLFAVALLFSLMARWEQVAIILLYLVLECRISPFRARHKTALLFMLGALTVIYPLAIRFSGIDLAGFLAVAESFRSDCPPGWNSG